MNPVKTHNKKNRIFSGKKNGNSGFTIVEVLVAMGLLLCFTIAICSMEILSFRNTHTLYHEVLADQVLGDVMRDLRYNTDKIPDNQSGERVISGITYTWQMKLEKVRDKRLEDYFREVIAECTWTDQMGSHKRIRHSMVTFTDISDDSN